MHTIEDRDTAHRRSFGDAIVLKYVRKCDNIRDVENNFKRYARQINALTSVVDKQNKHHVEIVHACHTLDQWIGVIVALAQQYEKGKTVSVCHDMEYEKELTKRLEIEQKTVQFEIEQKEKEQTKRL